MNITSQIILETNLYMSFEIKDDKLWFELDEPEDKDLTISIINYTSKEQYIIRQDEPVEPLDLGSYIFVFNTPKKTALSVIFKNNKLAFGIL
jgi:hypothetical protein